MAKSRAQAPDEPPDQTPSPRLERGIGEHGATTAASATAVVRRFGQIEDLDYPGRAGAETDGEEADEETTDSAPTSADDGEPPPDEPAPATRRHGPARRILLVLTALLSLAIVGVTSTGWLIVTFYDRRIDRETIAPPADITVTRPPPAPVGAETWLLVGSDVRTGSDAAEINGARSDTMMIAHLSSDGRTTIVSIPRDLRVPIPAWTDDDGARHRAQANKVNAAFSAGGPSLLVATLEQVAGLRIDHYAELDFNGFQQMTTAIGGIDVCLQASPYVEVHELDNGRVVRSTNLNDPSSGFVGQPGTNHLAGANALGFVRQRHGFADGDLSRIRRQQAFLAAVFRKVTSEDVLLSPSRLTSFLGAVTGSAVLDEGTGLSELRGLATRLRQMTTGAVTFSTIPITGQISRPAFYFLYDPDDVRQFFRDITGDTTPFDPADQPLDPLELGATLTPGTAGPSGAAGEAPSAVPAPAEPPATLAPTPTTTPQTDPSDLATWPGTTTEPRTTEPADPRTPPASTQPTEPPASGTWPQPLPTALFGSTTAARPVSWVGVAAVVPTSSGGPAVDGPSTADGPAVTASPSSSVTESTTGDAPVTAAAACIY